jgi:uncharacterized protein YdcH (DUF465 family)
MPSTTRDIREQLLANNPKFQQLALEHSKYDAEIEQLSQATFLNVEHFAHEAELKKLRLRVKDEMERLIAATSQGRQVS